MGFLNDLLSDNTVRKVEQFTKPGTANVSPADLAKLRPLIEHYRKSPHPFTACYRDQIKHGLSPNHAARRCAVLKDLMMGTTSWRKGGQVAKADLQLDGFEQLEAEEEIRKHLDEVPTEEQYLGEILGLIRHAPLVEIRERFAKVRGDNPRWPKGTPGIGGQWRPDGMSDGVAAFAARALGQLDRNNEVHKEIAKDFNEGLKQKDWKSMSPAQEEQEIHNSVRELAQTIRSFGSGGPASQRFLDARRQGGLRVRGRDVMPGIEQASERARTGNQTVEDIKLMRAGEEFTLPNGTKVRRVPGGPVQYQLTPKGSNTSHVFRPDRVRQAAEEYERAGGPSSLDSPEFRDAVDKDRRVKAILEGISDVRDSNKLYRAYKHWNDTGDSSKLDRELKRRGYNPDGTKRSADSPRSGGGRRSAPTGDTGNLPSAGETKHFPGDGGQYKVEAKADGGYAITRPSGTTRNFKKPAGAKRFMRAHNVGGTSSRNAEAPQPPQPRSGRAARNAARRADAAGTPGGPRSGRAARNADRQARSSQIASKVESAESDVANISGRQKSTRQNHKAENFARSLSPTELDRVIAHYEANPPRKAAGKKVLNAAKSLKAQREQRASDRAAGRPINGLPDGVKATEGPGEGRRDGMIYGEVDGKKISGYKAISGKYVAYYEGERPGGSSHDLHSSAKEAVAAAAKRYRSTPAGNRSRRVGRTGEDPAPRTAADLSGMTPRQLAAVARGSGPLAAQAQRLLDRNRDSGGGGDRGRLDQGITQPPPFRNGSRSFPVLRAPQSAINPSTGETKGDAFPDDMPQGVMTVVEMESGRRIVVNGNLGQLGKRVPMHADQSGRSYGGGIGLKIVGKIDGKNGAKEGDVPNRKLPIYVLK